ncbi:hypothetical protein JCM11251_003647 [Rhodosporidiobolus azoricus]
MVREPLRIDNENVLTPSRTLETLLLAYRAQLSFLRDLVFGSMENKPASNVRVGLESPQLSSLPSSSLASSTTSSACLPPRPMRLSPFLSASPPIPEDTLDVLPTPEEVSQHGTLLHRADQSSLDKSIWEIKWNGLEIVFKCGKDVKIEEGKWTEMVREMTDLPIPRVYGTCLFGDETLIYLEKMPGQTLHNAFPFLSSSARSAIVEQLKAHMKTLHGLQAAPDARRGGFGGRNLEAVWPVRDHPFFSPHSPSFPTCAALHEWLRARYAARRDTDVEVWDSIVAPFLGVFSKAVLVHGDLSPWNILVDGDKVTAIIDWEQAGYYPVWVEGLHVARRIANYGGLTSVFDIIAEGLWGASRVGQVAYQRLEPVVEVFLGE